MAPERDRSVAEMRRVPWLSVLFGYGAVVPFWVGAIAAWAAKDPLARMVALDATVTWGAVILAFLAGVRRGISLRTEGGPRETQIAVMIWLFGCAVAALLLPHGVIAFGMLLAAFVSLMLIDPIAARRGEVPLFFTRLRPLQTPLIVIALALCLARSL